MPRYARKFIFFLFVFLLIAKAAHAAFPAPVGYVNDFARVLTPATSAQLENLLKSFEQKSSDEIVVATLPSLNGLTVEDVAVELYKQWGIGKKGRDNGALFLVAPNERKMRIEVGYGLEGVINDALAGRLLDENVVPRFKSGDMNGGIAAGAIAIVKTVATKEGISFDIGAALQSYAVSDVQAQKKGSPLSIALKILFFLLMAYLFIRHPFLFLLFLSGGRGGGGGGFSGGFGGFGGGMSGGGGASRGW